MNRARRRLPALLAIATLAASGAAWAGCGDEDLPDGIEEQIRDEVDKRSEGLPEDAQKQIEEAQEEAERIQEDARDQVEEAQREAEDALEGY